MSSMTMENLGQFCAHNRLSVRRPWEIREALTFAHVWRELLWQDYVVFDVKVAIACRLVDRHPFAGDRLDKA